MWVGLLGLTSELPHHYGLSGDCCGAVDPAMTTKPTLLLLCPGGKDAAPLVPPLVASTLPSACFIVILCALPLGNSPTFGAEDVVTPKLSTMGPGCAVPSPHGAPELWVSLQTLQDPIIPPMAIGISPCPL